MKITQGFKTTIEAVFYDKTINILTKVITTDDEGWTKREDNTVSGSFKGNINFSNLEQVQKDYGIEEEVGAVITTNTNIANDTIIEYLDKKYKVIKAEPYDSHYFLIVGKWLSKSST